MIDLEGKLADSFRSKTLKWLSDEYYGTSLVGFLVSAHRLKASEWKELNGTQYDVLDRVPTPLEFSRLVHIARPVLIKGRRRPSNRQSSLLMLHRVYCSRG